MGGGATLNILTHYVNPSDLPEGSVINFSRRTGCVPCVRLAPHYEAAAEQLPDRDFYKVYLDEIDTDSLMKYVEQWSILGTPMVFKIVDGEEIPLESRTVVSLVKEINGE